MLKIKDKEKKSCKQKTKQKTNNTFHTEEAKIQMTMDFSLETQRPEGHF